MGNNSINIAVLGNFLDKIILKVFQNRKLLCVDLLFSWKEFMYLYTRISVRLSL